MSNVESRVALRASAAMKVAWEQASATQGRTISDWARRTLNDAAGYPPEAGTRVSAESSCARAATHRVGVYCKACDRTPEVVPA